MRPKRAPKIATQSDHELTSIKANDQNSSERKAHTTRKMINNDAFYASRKAKDDTSLKRPLRLCHYMC